MNRLGAALMMLCAGSACAQSWNNLRNDYRVQESNGFAYMYEQDGQLAYLPRLNMGLWTIDYPDAGSTVFATGTQMQPNSEGAGWAPEQNAVCRWTAVSDGSFRVRYSITRNTMNGTLSEVSVLLGEDLIQHHSINWADQGVRTGYFDANLSAGDSVAIRSEPGDVFSSNGDAINFELAIFGPCQADLDHDSLVDDSDFVAFVYHYDRLESVGGDFNDDGLTDDADFVAFAQAYDALLCD